MHSVRSIEYATDSKNYEKSLVGAAVLRPPEVPAPGYCYSVTRKGRRAVLITTHHSLSLITLQKLQRRPGVSGSRYRLFFRRFDALH